MRIKFPIHKDLLHVLLNNMQKIFETNNQPFLKSLYQSIFITAYYGLFHIGEITESPHVILVKDMHIAMNENKLLFIIHSSRTHCKADLLQSVKITGTSKKCYCPFSVLRHYLTIRPSYINESEQFFILETGLLCTQTM